MSRRASVRERDGIHLDCGGRSVVCDARSATGDVTVVSHAHADHAPTRPDETVVCSEATAAVVAARSGVELDFVTATEDVTLLPAGHVVGSRAALVEADRRYLYTGDVATRDRAYLDGFDPVPADVLVVEATYGKPTYRFPPYEEVAARVGDWMVDNPDRPLLLFGYSFGRAQKLQHLVREVTDRRLLVHPSVAAVNGAVEAATDLSFPATSLADVDEVRRSDVVVAPSGARGSGLLERAESDLDALTAGFSGWAADDSFLYRGGYDETFVLSDHCDFEDLVALVEAVDPEEVYTHHGFAGEFAAHLAGLGYDAVALRRDQARLSEFGNVS